MVADYIEDLTSYGKISLTNSFGNFPTQVDALVKLFHSIF